VLGTAVLALHHHPRRVVGNPYRRLGGINVLPARPTGAIGVNAQVGRIDIDLHVVIDLGGHENGRKRGMAPVAGVERGFAHQPMDAALRSQPPEGVVPGHPHGGTLNAGHVACGQLGDLRAKALALDPAQIHAQQEVGPVLGLGAAGTRLDFQERILTVHVTREHAAEFQAFYLPLGGMEIGLDRGQCFSVGLFLGHGQEFVGLRHIRR